jgi:hypothetical protein
MISAIAVAEKARLCRYQTFGPASEGGTLSKTNFSKPFARWRRRGCCAIMDVDGEIETDVVFLGKCRRTHREC